MKRRTFIQCGLGIALGGPLMAAVRNKEMDTAAKVLADAVAEGKVHAAALYVRHGESVFSKSFGASKSSDDIFLLASISKPMSVGGVMTLYDQGEFELDNVVKKFIPEFTGDGRDSVTMRQLLTHVSGLPDQLPENQKLRQRQAKLSEFVERAIRTPLLFKPGSRYEYSSMAILLATEVARRITGQGILDFVNESVFKPLGMQRSALGLGPFKLEETMRCQLIKANPESGSGDPSAKDWDWNSPYWRKLGSPWGGVHSSASDVARFFEEFLHPTGEILKPETTQLMVRNHNADELTPRGLGFSIGERAGSPGCSEKTFGHSGATGTLAWADPVTDTICVVLTTLPGQAANLHPRNLASDRVAKAVISSQVSPDASAQDEAKPVRNSARTRRVLYNFDGDSCLSTKAGSKGPVPVTVDDVKRLVEEVAYDGSRVDTVLVCVNAQVMYYPTKAGTMRGTLSTPEERAKWPASEKQRFENLKAFFAAGVDPYAVMLAETKRRGCEALLTFRMNDDHGNDFLRTQFLADHPDWRLGTEQYQGKGAMDFARDEVRDYTFRLIKEAVGRYDCDGIELDFNRFPNFFKDGSTEERVAKMNSLVERVRKMLDAVGDKRGKRLLLAVRVPSNFGRTPPTPETARQLGCDVPAWVKQGWVDFVAVSEFLHERGDLPIDKWQQAITTVPVYGGIECTKGGGAKNLTADEYRQAATQLIKAGSDGVYLFNFFTSREGGEAAYEPPFEVLRDLGAQ